MKYVIAIFLSLQVYAQKSYLFSAKGFTNIKSEKILLIQPFSKAFRLSEDRYQHEFPLKSDGTFSFTGTLQNPTCFVLITEDDVSEPFFLDNVKNQNIDYIENIDSTKVLRIIGSQSNEEYLNLKKTISESYIANLFDNRVNKGIEDYILLDYIKKNSSSYVALWLLIRGFQDNSPSLYLKDSLSHFSEEVKNTDLYKNIISEIENQELFREKIKNGFILKDVQLNCENIILKNKGKYILLDFWYSNCAPCLRELPKYVEVYNKFKVSNFEVIGVSIDKEKDLQNWRNKIKEVNITWRNYWDENSSFSKKMGVYKFPTNFLLNEEGDVIYQDITSEQLNMFLSKKLKKEE